MDERIRRASFLRLFLGAQEETRPRPIEEKSKRLKSTVRSLAAIVSRGEHPARRRVLHAVPFLPWREPLVSEPRHVNPAELKPTAN